MYRKPCEEKCCITVYNIGINCLLYVVISFCNSWCEQIKQLLLTSGAGVLAAVEILEPEQACVSQIA